MNFNFGEDFGNDVCMGDDTLREAYISRTANENFRSTELVASTMIEQKQESGKNVIVIDTGAAPLSQSTFDKVKKVLSSSTSKQKPVGEEASKQEQIEEFLKKYKTFTDVPVKDMRHIIPLLLMEVYVEKYGQYTRKVKGLWEKRPEDWPEDVPFVDPNNRLKNEGEKNVKPKKELLGQMLSYLVARYTKMKETAETSDRFLLHANDPLLCFPNQPALQSDDVLLFELNLKETNEYELRAAERSVSEQSSGHNSGYSSHAGYSLVYRQEVKSSLSSMTNDGSMSRSSLSTLGYPLSGGMDVAHEGLMEDGAYHMLELPGTKQPDLDARQPEQVVDNEEETSSAKDWNPLKDIRERTRVKLGFMKAKALVPKAVQAQLETIHGHLEKLLVTGLDDDAKFKLLGEWYQLEMCIDTAKFQQPYKYVNRIQELHDKLIPETVPPMDFMTNNTVNSKSMDLPVSAEDPHSLLNIRPRPGPAGGMVPFPTGDQLEVRCLTSNQSVSNDGCRGSMLSDNHKPIQLAQEDGEAQKYEKPELNLAIGDDLLAFVDDDVLKEFLLGLSSLSDQELSMPIQESAPVTQTNSQLAGKLEMPLDQWHHLMTNVSVQPWVCANPPLISTPSSVFSSAVGPSQPISNLSLGSPSTAVAEECINRLSLSPDLFPPQMQKAYSHPPVQPNLDQLLSKSKAVGRSGGKRCYSIPEDEDLGEIITGPSYTAKRPAYNTMIPLVVEEISNNPDKPFPRLLKKKSR